MEKQWSDQELQELFEHDPQAFAALARTNEDARLYALLFTSFSGLDTYVGSVNVSDRVLAKIDRSEIKSKKWQSLGWAAGISLAIIGSMALSFLYVPELISSIGNIQVYIPLLLVGVLLFIIVEYLDQKIIWQKAESQLFE